jgi:uncharacterized protein (TIGR03435 family)
MKKLLVLAAAVMSFHMAARPFSGVGHAQVAAPSPLAFEVASIKRNRSGDAFITMGMQPGGRLTMINVPARQLIVRAYQVQPYQVVGGPSWLSSDRFDVTAKAETDATPQQLNAMLRTLLADRFKLKARQQTQQSDVYHLVKARADGKLGAALKPAAVDCDVNRGRGAGPAAAPGGPAGAVPAARGGDLAPFAAVGGCQFMITPGRYEVSGQSMKTFADSLGMQVGRPVIDQTGLTGSYDLTLTFMPDGGRGIPPGIPPPGAREMPPIDPNAPALPTALQEQLGLKLESAKGPVEMIVIDSIEQPSED